MADNDVYLQGLGVKVFGSVVDIYYSDPMPVFNFTGVDLSLGATATSGIIYIATLDTLVPGLGAVAMLDLYTGVFTRIDSAYSTNSQGVISISGVEGLHRRRT